MKESRVCARIVSTGSEGIKQCEIITIRGNRVGAGQVLMSVIDMVQLVFSPGLFGVGCRHRGMMLKDAEECDDDWNCFGFCWGWLGRWAGGSWTQC